MESRPPESRNWIVANKAAVAAAVSLAALVTFLSIAGVFGGLTDLQALDALESEWFRDHTSHRAIHAFTWITNLGGSPVHVVVGVAVAVWLWTRDQRRLMVVWIAAVAGNAVLNRVLKELFERGRPAPLHDWTPPTTSYAFPSAHSSGAVAMYGALTYLALKLLPARFHIPCMVAAVIVILTIGTSRMALQVHFLTDVTAGFASGTAWLAAVLAVWWAVERRSAAAR